VWPQATRRSGFALRLEQGQGRLVLTERPVGDLVVVEQLQVALRHVPNRLDLSQGVERFRHQFGVLEQFAFTIDEVTLGQLLRGPAASSGLAELEVRIADGDVLVAGELQDGVPFMARARIEPASLAGERAVLVSVYELRTYGVARLAGPEIATALLGLAGLGTRLAGPTCAIFDPIDLGLTEVCAGLGWKLPDRRESRLVEARADAGRIRVQASRSEPARPGLRPVVEAGRAPEVALRYRRFLADYEAKTLYAALEAEIAAGRIDRAAAAYERQLELHPDHPFLVARLLQLWTVRAETRADALALARSHLERWPDDLDALVALGNVQWAQGSPTTAAETWRRVARIAEAHGDVVEAAQAYCGVARVLAPKEPAAAVEALERALALRRRLPGALRALASLHERAGNLVGAIQARERLLAGEEDAARRAALCFELGTLTLRGRHDAEAAIGWYERTLELAPEDVDAWTGLADAQTEAGRVLPALRSLDRAAQILQMRGDQSRAAQVHVRLGDLWRDLPEGGASTAGLRYRQALLLSPGLHGALLGLAETASREGDHRRARAHLEDVLRAPEVDAEERAEVHLRLGRLFAGPLEDAGHAALHFQRALEGGAEQTERALVELERLFRGLRRWDDLARTLEHAASKAERPEVQAERLGRLATVVSTHLGDTRRGLELQRRAVALSPRDPALLDGLLGLLRVAGEPAALVSALEHRVQLPGEPAEVARWHAERGLLLRERLNDADAAASAFALALGCDPASTMALEGLADIYRERERFAELAPLLSRRAHLATDPNIAVPLWLELARLQLGPLQRPEGARESLERVVEVAPEDTEALRGLATLHAAAGRFAPAERLMRTLLGVYEREGFDDPAGAFYATFAELLAAQRRDAEALDMATRARDADPDRVATYESAQDMLLRRGEVESIVTFFLAGLERVRRIETVVFLARRAGRLLWRELRRPDEAAPLLDRVLRERPEDADALRLRVEVATALADWPRVAEALRSQLDKASAAERPDVLVRLAELALGVLERTDEGVALLRAALQSKPGHRPAEERLFDHGVKAGLPSLVAEIGQLWLEGGTLEPKSAWALAEASVHPESGLTSSARSSLLQRLHTQVAVESRGAVARMRFEVSLASGALDDAQDALAAWRPDATVAERRSAHAALARALDAAGDTTRASEHWRGVLECDPEDPEAIAALRPAEPTAVEPADAVSPAEPEPIATPEPVSAAAPAAALEPAATREAVAAQVPAAALPEPAAAPRSADLRDAAAAREVVAAPEPAAGLDLEPTPAYETIEASEDPLALSERALRAAVDAAEGAAQSADALVALGEFLRDDRQELEAALDVFEEALFHAEPGSSAWRLAEEALEEVHAARNDWDRLLALYDLRLRHSVGDPTELNVLRASVLRRCDRIDDAIVAAEAGLPDERARDVLVSLLGQARRPLEAARRLTEDLVSLRPDEAAHRHWRAAGLLMVAAPAQALVHFQSAAAGLKDAALADEWLGHAREVAEPRALVAALTYRAECHGTTGGDAVRRSRLLFEAAGVLLEPVEDPRGARRLLERALEAWPDNVDALERLATALELLGDDDALAETLTRQIAAAVPGPWRGRLAARLADVHGRVRGDRVAAEAAAQQAAVDLEGTADVEALALWLTPAPAAPAHGPLAPETTSSEGALPAELTPSASTSTLSAPRGGSPGALPPLPTPVDAVTRHERTLTGPTASVSERVQAWRSLLELRTRVPDLQRLLGLLDRRVAESTDGPERAVLKALGGELWRARLGNVERARQHFEAALEFDASAPRAHFGLGLLALDRSELALAVDHLHIALENQAPRGGGLLTEEEMAAFHRLRRALGSLDRGLELVSVAGAILERNPGCRPALDAYDQALSQTERLPDVVEAYERALVGDDARRNARLWRRLAELLVRHDAPARAVNALGEALRLSPDDAHTRVSILRLAFQVGDRVAFRQHASVLILMPPERWVQTAEDAPSYLRSPEALAAAIER
jgi:tetratricopeptide (TPR) repeat protein